MRKITSKSICILSVLLQILISCSNKNDVLYLEKCGMILPISQDYLDNGIKVESWGLDSAPYPWVEISFAFSPETDEIFKEFYSYNRGEVPSDVVQKLSERFSIHNKTLAQIVLIKTSEYNSYIEEKNFPDEIAVFSEMEKIKEKNGYTYLLKTFENSTEGMSEEEAHIYQRCKNRTAEALQNIKFTKIKSSKDEKAELNLVPNFTSLDLEGNSVTEKIFGEKKLTVLNIWATYCEPCLIEMPALAAWAKELPDSVQVVGIVSDVVDSFDQAGIQEAQKLTSESGVEFTNILANSDFSDFLSEIPDIPSTYIVDKNGRILSGPIAGSRVSAFQRALEPFFKK